MKGLNLACPVCPEGPVQTPWLQGKVLTWKCAAKCDVLALLAAPMEAYTLRLQLWKDRAFPGATQATQGRLPFLVYKSWAVPLDRQGFPGVESILGGQGGHHDKQAPRLVSGTGMDSLHLMFAGTKFYENLWCSNMNYYFRKMVAVSVE